ncbi:MAG: BACON domain-containing protein [Bacteroidaceae bacterium]|nr:BACON domain-containing protein [Bacteroidaceae bacterium]
MYKVKILLLACSSLFLIASCSSDPETHELIPVEQPFILYADQTVDSVQFYTFDSWTVTPEVDWISVEGKSHLDIPYDYTKRYLCRVFLNLQPNTTGETRSGTVLVQSHDYSYSAPFVQLGMLYVSHPQYVVDAWFDDYYIIPKVAHYELVDSAHWTEDSICFTVENNWDLEFVNGAPDWLSLDKTTDLPGHYRVNLALVPNTDTENGRQTTLKLTSGNVSNEIVVRQLPAKKEEE